MSQTEVTAILAAPSALALIVLWRGVHAWVAEWDSAATFILVMGWLFVLPDVLSGFLGGSTPTFDVELNPILVLAPWVVRAQHLANYALIAVPVLFLLVRVRPSRGRGQPLSVPIMLALVVWVVAAFSSYGSGTGLFTKASITLAIALLAALALPRGRGAALGAATFGVSFAVANGLLPLAHYSTGVAPCSGSYKCGPLGVFVLGSLTSENALGLVMCAALPFVWLAFSGKARACLVLYVFALAVVTSSRTSEYAAVAILAVLIVARPDYEKTTRPIPVTIAGFGVLAGVVAGALLPYLTTDPDAYTERGFVWLVARQQLHGHYLYGLGSPAWSNLVTSGNLMPAASYSTHNQWLDVLWISGVIGAVGIGLLIVMLLVADFRIALAVISPAVFAGITERLWSISHLDTWSFAYLAALLAVPVITREPRPPKPQFDRVTQAAIDDVRRAEARREAARR